VPLDSLLKTLADGGLGRRNKVSASPQEKVTGSLLERKLHNLHSLNVGNNVTFLTLSIMEDVTIQRLSEKSELLVVILYRDVSGQSTSAVKLQPQSTSAIDNFGY
jgi:hypothetical protein